MRILLVVNTLPPKDISGVGEQVLQLQAGLEDAGHQVEVLGRGEGLFRRAKGFFPVTVLPILFWRLLRHRYDVVQVHESDGGFAALLTWVYRSTVGFILRRRPRIFALLQVSYVQEIAAVRPILDRGTKVGEPGRIEIKFTKGKAKAHIFLGKLAVRWSDLVLAPSKRTGRELRKDYRARDVHVLHNVTGGLEVDESTPIEDLEPGYFLYVGRLRVRKAVEVLIEAMRQLDDGSFLVIAGDGEQKRSLEDRVQAYDLDDRVKFLGRQDAGQVRQLLRQACALVVPSIYEGMPLVILEAMSEAVPVIATTVSGIPEVVDHKKTGWLVEPENAAELAQAMRQAFDDPDEASKRGRAGLEKVEHEYAPANAAEEWLQIYRSARNSWV